MLAMLRTLRDLGYLDKGPFEEFARADPAAREKELFGALEDGEGEAPAGAKGLPSGVTNVVTGFLSKFKKRPIPSDRYRLLQREAARKVVGEKSLKKGVQKKLPTGEGD
jgi:hypothetical protein